MIGPERRCKCDTGAMMYEDVFYEKPFLKEVIARIDFVAPLEGAEKSLPQKLAKQLSDRFPIKEPMDAIAQELQVTAGEVKHRKTQFRQWNFFGREREKQLSLAPSFILITYKQYTTFEETKEEFSKVVNALEIAFPDVRAARFGLRYINSIEDVQLTSPTDWGAYIARDLLGTMAFFAQPERLTRLIQVTELKHGDLDMRFQFGMPNPDYPALIKRPQFVLDLDGYVRTAHDVTQSLRYMDQAHEQIQDLFERSITRRLREQMNVRPSTPVQE
jgi:uncharacterized protein (TIGR04255 family)